MGVYTEAEVEAFITALQTKIENIQTRIDILTTEGALPYKSMSQSVDPAKMIEAWEKILARYRQELKDWEKELRMLQYTGPKRTLVFGTGNR